MSDGACNRAYLALGSNIDAEQNLPEAVRELANYGRVVAVSSVWETPPVGFADQPNFLNAAVLLETKRDARALRLITIADIERRLNRVRDPANKNAPRTIDIDIALFNRDVFQIESRKIPDPDVLSRAFVAIPLAEIEPDYVHPQTGRTLSEIAAHLESDASNMKLRPDIVLPVPAN